MFSFHVVPSISVGSLFERLRLIYLHDEEVKSPLPSFIFLKADKEGRIHYFQVPYDIKGMDLVTGSLLSRLNSVNWIYGFEIIDEIDFHRAGSINDPLTYISLFRDTHYGFSGLRMEEIKTRFYASELAQWFENISDDEFVQYDLLSDEEDSKESPIIIHSSSDVPPDAPPPLERQNAQFLASHATLPFELETYTQDTFCIFCGKTVCFCHDNNIDP